MRTVISSRKYMRRWRERRSLRSILGRYFRMAALNEPSMGILIIFILGLSFWGQIQAVSILKDPFYEELRRLMSGENNFNFEDEVKKPIEVQDWSPTISLGQITAVAVNLQGNPVIFHRADRVWDESSFNESHVYQQVKAGPIKQETIVELDATRGAPLTSWGSGMFYMPHGLTLDQEDNVWLTDVAMHQVFKYPAGGSDVPLLTLGRQFEGGLGQKRGGVLLCMPTSVAISSTGNIFVADGYCNNQILQFNRNGRLLRTIPQPPHFLSLQVPHSLALMEELDLICVADRENMRVVCERAGLNGPCCKETPPLTIHAPDLGRVFAVAAHGNLLYAVNGPTSSMIPISGFTINPRSETILDHWQPLEGFNNPHSIAISRNGSHMYVTEIGPNKIWKFQFNKEI